MNKIQKFIKTEVLIIGASASGLMCAIEAGKRGRKVIVLDHANKVGKKIIISGGGRCNFSNYDVSADNYISHNSHFCKSALSRFSQWDFITLISKHKISFHEREQGQLFCDNSSEDILEMLLNECNKNHVEIKLNCGVSGFCKDNNFFTVTSSLGAFQTESLIMATGGLSIPKAGASPIGYQVAKQFGHHIWPTRAGLVPLTLQLQDKELFSTLSGIAVDSIVSTTSNQFREQLLFTHRGLSGPAILQISSYWEFGEEVNINLLPGIDLKEFIATKQSSHPKIILKTALSELLPKRLLAVLINSQLLEKKLSNLANNDLMQVTQQLHNWHIKPNGTEGYRTAEVTLGGVDCDELSSKTMESNKCSGLYFVGEVVDVTGWLGGYNLQWAWSSGWAAGQVV